MSAFLGPIHHWLYRKVLWHEELLEAIYSEMQKNGHDPDALRHYAQTQYGIPETGALEDVIDTANIHGWLQDRIHSLEHRMAYAITTGLKQAYLSLEDLKTLYRENGRLAKNALSETLDQPDQVFKAIYDYLLEGMPCDRVNQPISSDENSFSWVKRLCIHTDFWNAVGGDIEIYNTLRLEWIDAFVEDAYRFESVDENTFVLSRRAA